MISSSISLVNAFLGLISFAHLSRCSCLFGTKVLFNDADLIIPRKYSICSRIFAITPPDTFSFVTSLFIARSIFLSLSFPPFPPLSFDESFLFSSSMSSSVRSNCSSFRLIVLLWSIFCIISSIIFAGIFACWIQNFAIFSTSSAKNIVGPSVNVCASFVVM